MYAIPLIYSKCGIRVVSYIYRVNPPDREYLRGIYKTLMYSNPIIYIYPLILLDTGNMHWGRGPPSLRRGRYN